MKKVDVNTLKSWRTNDVLYARFFAKAKLCQQKVYERLNDLILEDLDKPFEVKLSPSQQHKLMFEDIPEIINESAEEDCSEEQSA